MKGASAGSGHVSSSIPLRTVAPVNQVISLQSGDDNERPRDPNDEHHSPSPSPCGSVNESVHHFTNVEENQGVKENKGVERSPPRVEAFVNMSGIRIHPTKERRALFSLERRAMAQTDILERFENLLADYDTLADTHAECSETVWKLVTAREDLEHNAKLYTDAINSYRVVKEEHAGLPKSNCWRLSWLGKTALTYAERILAKGAKYCEKLTAQLGQAEIENFDCIRKLLPTVLFEKKYPYNEKFSRCYRDSVADLLKVYPDPAPFTCTSTPTISKDLGGSGAPPKKKKT
ncbi:hypothetical protein Tco_0671068 [Tanacetum coccineum]